MDTLSLGGAGGGGGRGGGMTAILGSLGVQQGLPFPEGLEGYAGLLEQICTERKCFLQTSA